MQVVFGIVMIITGAASGLLFQDPVVCRFNESNQCFVALGQQLHLQMPLEDKFSLKIKDKTFIDRIILKYRKNQSNPPTPNITGWQFVNDNKTLILTSAERRDSGTYTLDTFDVNGTSKGSSSLQLNIEAQVSSVKVSYSCLSPGVMKVSCSADGDNLRFNWTSDLNTLSHLENRISTLILDKDHHGKVTCSVENHVSRDHITTELHSCPESTTASSTAPATPGTNGTNPTVSHNTTNNSTTSDKSTLLNPLLISLSSVCVLLIMISILAFCMYKKRQGQKKKEAPSQEGRELMYAQVGHLPMDRVETRPGMSHAQDNGIEYAEVPRATKKKQKKKEEDEVQYGELVFNTPAKNKHKVAKEQDECVYSHVQHNR